jgi:hypothetical protein
MFFFVCFFFCFVLFFVCCGATTFLRFFFGLFFFWFFFWNFFISICLFHPSPQLVKQRIDSIEAECRRGKDFLRTLYAKRAGDETQLRDRAYEMGRERHVEAQIDHGALDHNSEASVRVMARPNAVGTSGSVLLQLDEDDDDDEISDGADGDLLLSGDDMVDDEEDGLGPNDAGADDEEEEEDDDDEEEEENNNNNDDAEDADLLYVAGSGPANSELPAAKRLELARAKRRAAVQAAYLARVVESLHGAIRADRKRELSEEKQLALCARRVEAARTRLAVLSASLNDATRTAHTALEEEQIGARAAAKDKLNADNARDKALADEQAATRAEREEMQLEVAASSDRNEAKALDREAKTVGENDRKEEEQRREAQEKERAEMKAAARREEELDKKIVFPNA